MVDTNSDEWRNTTNDVAPKVNIIDGALVYGLKVFDVEEATCSAMKSKQSASMTSNGALL